MGQITGKNNRNENGKIIFKQGVKYRGFAFINEYGEWAFRPHKPSDNPNGMKIVMEIDNQTLYESSNMWKLTLRFNKLEDREAAIGVLASLDAMEEEAEIPEMLRNTAYLIRNYITANERKENTDTIC